MKEFSNDGKGRDNKKPPCAQNWILKLFPYSVIGCLQQFQDDL
jgi:hypothetical protein